MINQFEEYKSIIAAAYESQVTMDEAEKLAARFLHVQMVVAQELHNAELDARMRKTGLKTLKSAIRTNEISKCDKKPTEAVLDDAVNTSELVIGEQNALDAAEVHRDNLQNHLNIFKDAHIFFRAVSRGRFE